MTEPWQRALVRWLDKKSTAFVQSAAGDIRRPAAKTDKTAQRTLPGADFLWLVLQHVLPRGLGRPRNFGCLHPNSAGAIGLLQVLRLRAPPGNQARPAPARAAWRCACGEPMQVVRRRMPALQAADEPSRSSVNSLPVQVKLLDKPGTGKANTMH